MASAKIVGLRCTLCGLSYGEGEVEYTCPSCGVEGILDVELDYERIAAGGFSRDALAIREPSIWRYFELLPLSDRSSCPTLDLRATPVYGFDGLARHLGIAELLVKDEGRLPSGSFKDRASAVAAARASELGLQEISCASTGNAASSLATMAANLGLHAHIFVPSTAPDGKVAQLLVSGADVLLVDGSYADAYALSMEAADEFGWYNRNCAVNPYCVEGKKTCGLEIAEQLGPDVPDWVAVAVGDGCTVWGIWKGLREMCELGFIDRLPRLLGVQADGADPIYRAFRRGDEDVRIQEAETLADSIAVGHPRNGVKALRAIRESGGEMVIVEDGEILAAIPELAGSTGVFGEPAGVAPLAGIKRARASGTVGPRERVLLVMTGNGLKDVRSAVRAAGEPRRIDATMDALRASQLSE